MSVSDAPLGAAPTPGHVAQPPLLEGRATVLDVARLAGVSGRTVSRVVVGGANVSEETRERVVRAVETLRFRPNRLARDLRTGGISTTVGFVVGDLTNAFYAKVASGVESVLAEFGLTMLLAATRDDPSRESPTVAAVLEHRVRALLLVPVGEDHAYLEHERRLGTPIVGVDRPAANANLDSVVFDNRGGAYAAVRSLIDAGHRRIAFVGSDNTIYTHEQRLSGYRQALEEAALPVDPNLLRRDAPDSAAAGRAAHELLRLDRPPTAIFAANNIAALGALNAVREQPCRIGFVAFDDFDFADALKITVVSHDPAQMGREAASLALAPERQRADRPVQVVLPTRLVKRGSGEIAPDTEG